jgi:hypothetical protein
LGKLRAWCRGGGAGPPDLTSLGPDVWTADKPAEQNGLVILGTPLGTNAFVDRIGRERVIEEQRLLTKTPQLPDLQCAWILLSLSAQPRANHMLRVVPPSQKLPYARAHDDIIWQCFCNLLQAGNSSADQLARDIASLPARLGGLGLRSAARTSQPAYLASWADALGVLGRKAPVLAAEIAQQLQHRDSAQASCLREATTARVNLQSERLTNFPEWNGFIAGVSAPTPDEDEPEAGE